MSSVYSPVSLDTALSHGLTPQEYEQILEILGRTPTFVELGIFSAMWSEHCSYKNSILELKRFPKSGKRVLVEAGEENAGLIDIGDGLAVCFKIESHNHPSAIEPFQGAATGVGGILRDIFSMGARPIACLNSLRFGDLSHPRTAQLLDGVVRGISHYGNCFGVPTVGGEIYFDPSYNENPLVNAMAVGVVEVDKIIKGAATGAGNPVFVVGSSTGRDGIHGASFASEDLSEASKEKRPSVQIGDPFKEKLLLEASLELARTDALVGMQDMGAAGICCSCSETPARGGTGLKLDVDKVSRRESSMNAYEICLSESQERMLVILKKGKEHLAKDIFSKWDLHADEVGVVTDDKLFTILENGNVVGQIPADSLVLGGGAPQNRREHARPAHLDALLSFDPTHLPDPDDWNEALLALLKSPNIASRRFVFEQYDHTIGAATAQGGGASDAGVVRIPGTQKGLAMSVDCNSRYVSVDPRRGAALAVLEGARNVACAGAIPVGITNCLNFANPMKPENYYFFHESVTGISDACVALDIPVTGGNVSFYNESASGPVRPTPVIGMVGVLEDVSHHVGIGFKEEGDFIALLGSIGPDLGCSEYLAVYHNVVAGAPPKLDLEANLRLIRLLPELAKQGIVRSAHDLSEGGLAVAVSECSLAGNIGCLLTFPWKEQVVNTLFAESQACALVTVSHEQWPALKRAAEEHVVPLQMLGRVGGELIAINDWITLPLELARDLYDNSLADSLGL
ncbi:MAG: phosphoribosylformylglycinamidine synthase subunit PurL [Calditrichaeota bacterium]|nr:phosphoribosylformylglycinamidine synthase subunit PurL [Calditrichota bacterium]MCB9366477.1 phosphoribosylformylglycinamidine synthase subunit PurL [Calditrichota bacterium]MCB9391265.1 phosphoribosylformylglycinamidine synthase subunit PurL [Calditrichota bacterium]